MSSSTNSQKKVFIQEEKKENRRFCLQKIFTERKQKGEFYTLVQDLKLFDSEYFFKQFRMTARKLEEFPGWKAPRILKLNVKYEAISLEDFV